MAIEVLDSGTVKALISLSFNTLYTEVYGKGAVGVEHVAEGEAIVELEDAIGITEFVALATPSSFPGAAPVGRVAQIDWIDATHIRVRLFTVEDPSVLGAGGCGLLVMRTPMPLIARNPPA